VLDRIDRAAMFEVLPADVFGSGFQFVRGGELGVVFVEASWRMQQNGLLVAESTEVTKFDEPSPTGDESPAPKKKKKVRN
jgi:hypothetical protein